MTSRYTPCDKKLRNKKHVSLKRMLPLCRYLLWIKLDCWNGNLILEFLDTFGGKSPAGDTTEYILYTEGFDPPLYVLARRFGQWQQDDVLSDFKKGGSLFDR